MGVFGAWGEQVGKVIIAMHAVCVENGVAPIELNIEGQYRGGIERGAHRARARGGL